MKAIRKTKIICTMGPSTQNSEIIKELLNAGMNVARFNFSHGSHESQTQMVELVRKVSRETGIPVAIMLDTKGPEIRTGQVPNGEKITLKPGNSIIITTEECTCSSSVISISYKNLPNEIKKGNHIFIADGLIDLEVDSIDGDKIKCVIKNGGEIGSKKNVNVPGVRTKLPSVTDQDIEDIRFGIKLGIDMIAASFIRKPQDITAIHNILKESRVNIPVIAKIEDEEGITNLEEIIRIAGGIMVARGDLGVQLEPEEIPLVQKRIIKNCHAMGKPVITATQMLESMVKNPRPTRAEVSDVANAIIDGTDAVMLSGETASGDYPVEAVNVMTRIALSVENSEEYRDKMRLFHNKSKGDSDVVNATCRSACIMAEDSGAVAIITPTMSGFTARAISHYRPEQPIVAVTTSESVQRQLLLNWGVYPLLAPFTRDSEGMIQNAIKAAIKAGFAEQKDKVIVAAGLPVGTSLMTNAVRAYYLGNVIGYGASGFGKRCTGRIIKARTPEEAFVALKKGEGEILMNTELTDDFIPIVRMVKGIILERASEIPWQILEQIKPDLVFISEIPNAMEKYENGLTITIDGKENVIYEGVL